jgi:hypothetical protein
MTKKTFDFTKLVQNLPENDAEGYNAYAEGAFTDIFNYMHFHWPEVVHTLGNSGMTLNRVWGANRQQSQNGIIAAAALAMAFTSDKGEGFDYIITMFVEMVEAFYKYRCMMDDTGQYQDTGLEFARYIGRCNMDLGDEFMRQVLYGENPQVLRDKAAEKRTKWNQAFEPQRIGRMMMDGAERETKE